MTNIMKGFPVPLDQRVPRDDWDRAPWNRWSFQNVRELLPTAEVWRGEGRVWKFSKKDIDLGKVKFKTGPNETKTVQDWIDTSYTDGILVMHKGRIVFEQYHNDMTVRTQHLSQSMAKSIVAVLAGILIDRGDLNPDEKVTTYLPELVTTGWNGATLQQVMDMTTGVAYSEDYTAAHSDIAITDIASGWKQPKGIHAPVCIWDQILTLTEVTREHGTLFGYKSIETDVMAHCVERVAQTRLPELMSRELWQPLGCEENAYFTVDSVGYALSQGGFNATLRDYARFGQMLAQGGKVKGKQIVSKKWVETLSKGDNRLFQEPYTEYTPNGAYRNQFWIPDVDKKAFMARGVFGQMIYIDPENNIVVVKLSSDPDFISGPRYQTKLQAVDAIVAYLNFIEKKSIFSRSPS